MTYNLLHDCGYEVGWRFYKDFGEEVPKDFYAITEAIAFAEKLGYSDEFIIVTVVIHKSKSKRDWEAEFIVKRMSEHGSITPFSDRIKGEIEFIKTLLAAKDREKEHVIQNIINLADELESECNNDKLGDKGTQQWQAFKGFRNTIRDKYLNN